MIYLLSQMLIALALAAVCGGAIGWLIHRSSHARQIEQLRSALGRQKNQLEQARSDVSMLTDDYDDLHQRTQAELDELREENRQIPFLNTNLEKSQLLVRQMMQRHEAKIRDLTNDNQTLKSQLRSTEQKLQTFNQAQAELDSMRRAQLSGAGGIAIQPGDSVTVDSDGDQTHDLLAAHEPFTDTELSGDKDSVPQVEQRPDNAVSTADDTVSNRRNSGSWASAPLPVAEQAATNSVGSGTLEPNGSHSDISDYHSNDSVSGESLIAEAANRETDVLATGTQESAAIDSDADNDPFDDVVEIGDDLQRELDIEPDEDLLLDGSSDRSNLFEPVEQRDDLKQIFGIGPVTEKALNDLGITSYSQLADLKHHDIETIANALSIVPGRIERDDWVGNARRQLEDVLEQL